MAIPAATSSTAELLGGDEASPAPVKLTDRYVICGKLGAGGMATVHLGRLLGAEAFARTVAIKRLHSHFATDPDFRLMLTDEARLAARVRHPNAVQMLDIVSTPDELFLVMEYIDGVALSRLLRGASKGGTRIPESVMAAIASHLLHGLHAAHEATDDDGVPLNIVHRDVSPDNVLVGSDGLARVLDFGIAKATSRLQTTRNGEIKGKLSYMAPEQLSGRASRQSDIFSASIVLWEGLVGTRLFRADDDAETVGKVLACAIDPPSSIVAGLSTHLSDIVMRGLARLPADRWATARDMALALEARVPMATPSQVGAWVESMEGPWLAERRALVRRTEAAPASGDRPVTARPPPVTPVSHDTDVAVAYDATAAMSGTLQLPDPPRRRSRSRYMLGGAAVVACAAPLAWAVSSTPAGGVATGASPTAAPSETSSSVPLGGTAAASPPTMADSAQPAPLPTVAKTARAARRPAPVAPAAGKVDKPPANPCDPPYHLGPMGEKVWVKSCL
jgi:eukaryotic-like serine/threonine-protein kinase